MITTEAGLQLALEQLAHVYKALAALNSGQPRVSDSWRAVMAEGWIDQARQLHDEIAGYTGLAALEESQAELWLSVEGQGIEEEGVPASVLTALLDTLRKGVQAVAEFPHAGHRDRRPPAALKEACDWRVVAVRPGRLKIGVRLPEPSGPAGERGEGAGADVRRAVQVFLDVATWAASDEEPEALDRRFPHPEERRLVLNAVKPLVPRPRGEVEKVTVSGRVIPSGRSIVLTRAASGRIDRAIDRTAAAEVEEHVGDLREIDLDNHSLAVRNAADVREVRCTFDESLLQAAKEALDRRVRVSGIRQPGTGRRASASLHVFRLELLDEPASETGTASEAGAAVAD